MERFNELEDFTTAELSKKSNLAYRYFLNLLNVFLIVCLLVLAAIQLPVVQNSLKDQVLTFVNSRVSQDIIIKNINFDFASGINSDLLILDHCNDTLIYSSQIKIGLIKSLYSLYYKKLFIDQLDFRNTILNIITYSGDQKSNLELFLDNFRTNSKGPDDFGLSIRQITFSNINLILVNPQTELTGSISKVRLKIDSINYPLKFFNVRSVLLDNPNVIINKYGHQQVGSNSQNESLGSEDNCRMDPAFFIGFFNCNNGTIQYSDYATKNLRQYHFRGIQLSATHSYISRDLKQIEFASCNSTGEDDFSIKNLILNRFIWAHKFVSLDLLKFQTNRSEVNCKFKLFSNNTLKDFYKNNDLQGYFHMNSFKLSPKDVKYLIPEFNLSNYLKTNPDWPIVMSGKLEGSLTSLQLKDFSVEYDRVFFFKGEGQARNIFTEGNQLINLKVSKSNINSAFFISALNQLNIPSSYKSLGTVQFKGSVDGFLSDLVAYGVFKTDIGIINSDIKLGLTKDISKSSFSGNFSTVNFNLGALLNDSRIGLTTAKAIIKNGKGLTVESFDADVDLTVSDIMIRNYPIREIKFTGLLNVYYLEGSLSITDPNIRLFSKGSLQKISNIFIVKAKTKIDKIDFQKLNMINRTCLISGTVDCDLSLGNKGEIFGSINASDMVYDDSLGSISLKPFSLTQQEIDNSKVLEIMSSLIDLKLKGRFKYEEVGNDIIKYLDQNYQGIANIFGANSSQEKYTSSFIGNLHIKDGKMVQRIFNLPVVTQNLDCDFEFRPDQHILDLRTNRFDVVLDKYKFTKLALSLRSEDLFKLVVTLDKFSLNDKLVSGNSKIVAALGNTYGNSHFQIYDTTNSRILLNAFSKIEYSKTFFKHSFINKDLYINEKKWTISESNSIVKKKNTLEISNFELTDKTHYISIRDYDKKGLVLHTDGFNLNFVNSITNSKSVQFEGIFSSTLTIPGFQNLEGSSGELKFVDFVLNKSHFGQFSLKFGVPDLEEPWPVIITSKNGDQELKGQGTINIPLKADSYKYNPFDFSVDFSLIKFPFNFLESFVGSMSRSRGSGDGKIRFYSENNSFNLEGNVLLNKAYTFVEYLGVPVHIDKQNVLLEKNRIYLNQITAEDSLGNNIFINGFFQHNYLKDWGIDLRVNADNALALNTKKGDNLSYYGYGIGKFDATFKGLMDQIQLDITAESAKGTKIIIPMGSTSELSSSTFVNFVSNTAAPKQKKLLTDPEELTGINLNMLLRLDDNAEVSVIFDEITGDILRGSGRGNLLIKSLRNGLFSINGDYEIEQGQYLFTLYNFVNKPFTLTRGGVANWTGDPLNAIINVEAVYEGLIVSPYLLIQEYLAENQLLAEEAKRRTPVKLKMLLTGSLLKPTIQFDIELPELTGQLKNFAENKIRYLKQNQDQLNQQIFGLLVLGTFLNSTNPWEGGLISNLNTTATNTVSEMIFTQLSLFMTNLLSNAIDDINFISGIDVNIGYDRNEQPVGGTNLSGSELVFSLRPRLWNDQFIFTLGGNYKSYSQLIGNSYFSPESVIEWNTPIQGLKLRVYYRGDESIEGIKHKVGAGINIRKEFDNFLDFKKAVKDKARSVNSQQN